METTETKFSPRRYGANWLIITVVLITGLSAGFGWNTVTKSVDLFDGFSTLWDIFGGITSFGGILFLLLCVAIIVYGLHKMTQTDYTQSRNKKRLRWVHIGFGFAFVAFAAWMGV